MSDYPFFQHATPAFRTFWGGRSLASLPKELDRLGCRRAVIVSDPWMLTRPDIIESIEAELGARMAGLFTGVEMHSPVPSVESARDVLEGAGADAVVALGGGSSIVTARAATILLAEGLPIRELCTRRDADGRLTSPRLNAPKIPNWVIPSTPITAYAKAGSAVRDPVTGERLALYDPKTRAQGIIIDPNVALSAAVGLAQAAALNAFSMAVESLQAGVDDPLADALLLHSLKVLAEWLPRLRSAPDDAEPRIRLMLGALMCGQGSDYVGGGLAQALSHAAGPRSSVGNGMVEALLLPHTMRFNSTATTGRLALVAQVLSSTLQSAFDGDEEAVIAVESVLDVLDVPRRLRDVGVTQEAIPEIVHHALDDWSIMQSPRKVDRENLTELLEAAW
jgi:alcohol dehydrogenase class IV